MNEAIRSAIAEVKSSPDTYREANGDYRVDIVTAYLGSIYNGDIPDSCTLEFHADGRNVTLVLPGWQIDSF